MMWLSHLYIRLLAVWRAVKAELVKSIETIKFEERLRAAREHRNACMLLHQFDIDKPTLSTMINYMKNAPTTEVELEK